MLKGNPLKQFSSLTEISGNHQREEVFSGRMRCSSLTAKSGESFFYVPASIRGGQNVTQSNFLELKKAGKVELGWLICFKYHFYVDSTIVLYTKHTV